MFSLKQNTSFLKFFSILFCKFQKLNQHWACILERAICNNNFEQIDRIPVATLELQLGHSLENGTTSRVSIAQKERYI